MLLPIEQVKSPLTIKVALDRVAKAGLELTPEAMIMILKCTNHKVSIRDVLKMVPEGKEAEFKEAICSMAEHREHTDANLERMREIAKIGGFEAEFEEAHAKEKLIGNTFGKTFIAKSNEDLANNPDLTGYETVICDFGGKTKFADLTKLCKHMIIKGDIDWSHRDFEKLPDISESIVYGNFICNSCENLTSLERAPNVVCGVFYCGKTNITSLKGAPKEVGGGFYCECCNNLTSLEGAPKEVGGDFNCSWCKNLESLEGSPKKVGGSFDCRRCDKLEESGIYILQDGQYYDVFNLPKDKEFVINGDLDLSYYSFGQLPDLTNVVVKGDFDCHGCKNLTSLEGAPKEVGGTFNCSWCRNIISSEGLPSHIRGKIECDNKLRPEIDKELERRKKQANQSTLPPNGFGNSGR